MFQDAINLTTIENFFFLSKGGIITKLRIYVEDLARTTSKLISTKLNTKRLWVM